MTHQLTIPERLVAAIKFLRGDEDGERWLAQLPSRIAHYAQKWQLTPLGIAEGGAMSCCVFCETRSHDSVVLKIPAEASAGRREARASARWAETGAAPRVLDLAPAGGVYLMSRVRPGTTAPQEGHSEETDRYCELLDRMQDPALPRLARVIGRMDELARMRLGWAHDRFLADEYAAYRPHYQVAERVLGALTASHHERRVLHGDLQGKNVLLGAGASYVAIDAFLAVGDPNAEAALWATIQRNESRIDDRLVELARHPLLELERLQAWSFVFSVAEYRLYVPAFAKRMDEFVASHVVRFDRPGAII